MSRHLPVRPERIPTTAPTNSGTPAFPPSALLPLSRVCEMLGCNERTLRRWIKAGRLRAYRFGNWRVDPADLAHFLDRHQTGPRDDDTADGDVAQSQDDTQTS